MCIIFVGVDFGRRPNNDEWFIKPFSLMSMCFLTKLTDIRFSSN